MKRSTDRILTTHAGSLSRPANLIEMNRARASGESKDHKAYAQCLAAAVADVVRKQRDAGVDIVDDGEFGKPMAAHYDYGVWWNYAFARMAGFVSPDSVPESKQRKSSVADVALTTFANRRDWQKFSEFYQDPESTGTLVGSAARRRPRRPVCTGPIKYTGQTAIAADIDNLKKAIAAAGAAEGFICSIGPGSFARSEDMHYNNPEEFVFAAADAMREEYKAIVDAGLVLQIDDPSLPDNWDMINPEPPLAEFKKFERVRMEALNHALRGFRSIASAFTFAGEAGTVRTPPTFRSPTSSTSCSASMPEPIRWKRAIRGMSMNGASGKMFDYPTASCSFPASSATRPTSSSIRRWSRTGSCVTPKWSAARTSSPAPIAASAAAFIRRSPGRSSRRWRPAPSSRPRSCGASA
jgi:methionine synthase II (cobalamin-independent)